MELLENRIFLDANPLAAVDGGDAADAQDVHLEAAAPNDLLAAEDVHDGQSLEAPLDAAEVAEGDGGAESQDSAADGAEDVAASADSAPTVEDPDQAVDAEAPSTENGDTTFGDLLQTGDQQESPSADTAQSQDTDNDGDVTNTIATPADSSAQDTGVVQDAALETSADTADADSSAETLLETDGAQSGPAATLTDQHATDTTGEEGVAATETQDFDAVAGQDAAAPLSDAEQGELVVAETTDGTQEGDGDFLGDPLLTDASSQNAGLETEALDPMIGEDFSFTYSFENTLSQTGYGPYVDIYFPTSGLQGDHPDPQPPGSDIYDGIKFVSASYFDSPVTAVEQTFDATGQLEHPFAKDSSGEPMIVFGSEGDTYVSLQLPFGSYTPQQPVADIRITAHMSNLAEVDEPLEVTTSSGFMFGFDPLNNPKIDPSQLNQGATDITWLPEVIRYQKNHSGSEDETATGPNYTQSYSISVDVAAGQLLENIRIIDTVPDNIVFLGNVAGGTLVQQPNAGNGNTLIVDLGDITGVAGNDATVTFDFYVGNILADCDTSEQVTNDMHVEALWHPLDDRDPVVDPLIIDREVDDNGNISNDSDDVFTAQPLVIQKTASDENGGIYKPGDIVRYTLQFQISDYHALGNIEIQDLMSDGMAFYQDATHQSGFAIQDQYGNYTGDFTVGSDMDVISRPDLGDLTEIDFHVSQAIITAGDHLGDGILEGGRTNGTMGGAAFGTIVYYGQIQEHYTSPSVPVDQGDTLSNEVTVDVDRFTYTGGVLNDTPACSMTGVDGSDAEVVMPVGGVDKAIFAVDGAPVGSSPVHVTPESAVTYRLTYQLPNSDFNDMVLEDYLPLPIFDAGDPDHDPATANGWVTHFTASDIDDTVPDVGHVKFGPQETFFSYSGLSPAVSANNDQNALIFDWEGHYDPAHQMTTVDLLFTVKVSTEPFTNGLYLTNLVQAREDGNYTTTTSNDIIQVVLDEPKLEITKGVIATNNASGQFSGAVGPVAFSNPGSGGFRGSAAVTESGLDNIPIDADLSDIDAADLISFAIVVRNVGHYDAWDIHIDDNLPSGFEIPSSGAQLNLSVTDGAGNALTFTDGSGDAIGDAGFDFFNEGLEINTPLAGNIESTDQSDNILIITYDLLTEDTLESLQHMENTGEVTHYAAAHEGTNFIPQGIEEKALVTAAVPEAAKDLDSSEIENGANAREEVVIGEQATYTVTITLPEGVTPAAELVDTLDSGLTFAGLDSVQAFSGATDVTDTVVTTSLGSFSAVTPVGSGSGPIRFDLGTITNHDTDNDQAETLVLTYRVYADNVQSNQSGTQLDNAAVLNFTGGHSDTVDAPDLTVIEPDLAVDKAVTVNGSGTVGDAGDPVEYTIRMAHSGASETDAYDVTISDPLPAEISGAQVSAVTDSDGVLTVSDFAIDASNRLTLTTPIDMLEGRVITVTVTGTLAATVTPSQSITNTANVQWQSLGTGHANNGTSHERTGADGPGSGLDNYAHNDGATLQIPAPTIDKRASGAYTIGEEITYDIVMTLPEGTIDSLVVLDEIPDGLVYIGYNILPDGILNNPTVDTSAGDGNDVSFDFGIRNVIPGSSGMASDNFTLQVIARVDDIAANSDGVSLVNQASLDYIDADHNPQSIGPDQATVDIVEPWIATNKTVADESGDQDVARLGEVLTYTVRFENQGHSTAYEVDALDTLAPGTGFDGLSRVVYHDSAAGSDTDITAASFGIDNGDGTVGFGSTDGDSWDIAPGDYVEIQYSARVLAAWFAPGSHENTIDADWSGLDGGLTASPHQRIYDDGATLPGSPVDGDQDTDTAIYNVPRGDGEIGDTVWFDVDAGGGSHQDAGEPGIPGVELDLEVLYNGSHYYTTVTTDADGHYLFSHLQGNVNYVVVLDPTTLPAGMTETYALDGAGSYQATHFLTGSGASGDPVEHFNDADFSYSGAGVIGDYVWYDANQDGIQDPTEMPMDGVSIDITGDLDGDGTIDYTDTRVTDAHGRYLFEHLPFVNYTLTVDQTSLRNGLTVPTWDRDGALDHTTDVALTAAAHQVRDADFGYAGSGEIGNLIWDDLNADGSSDSGEPGLTGVGIILAGDLDGDGSPDFTLRTVTDGSGGYLFDALPQADYSVTIDQGTLPAGYIPSGDPDSTLDNTSHLILAAGAMDNMNQDFGYTRTGSIGDTVWYDADANSVQGAGEPGLAGVNVVLVGDVDLDGTPDTLTTTTDGSGRYLFDHLPLGNYRVSVGSASLPGGMRPTYDADGIGTPHTTAVSLAYGQHNPNIDFGYTGTGTIGDTVWNDLNRNGAQEAGEPGIAGVAVHLTGDFDHNGSVDYAVTASTDARGRYLFTHLPAGSYTLTLDPATLPPGLAQTHDPDGILDGSSSLRLRAGQHNLDQDFGYARPPYSPQEPVAPPVEPPFPPATSPEPGPPPTGLQFGFDALYIPAGPAGLQRPVENLWYAPEQPEVFAKPLIPVAPIYTGVAEPGTTLRLDIYDAMGNRIGSQTVMADTGGNWLAGFSGTLMYDEPHHVDIQQTLSSYNTATGAGYNLRTYFSPAPESKPFFYSGISEAGVFTNTASVALDAMHNFNYNPLRIDWDRFYGYEFLVSSANPSQSGC